MSKNTARRLDEIDQTMSKLDETLKKLDDSLGNIAKSMGRKEDGPFKFKAESRDTLLSRLKESAPAGKGGDAELFNQLKETLTKNHKESFELFRSIEKTLKSIEEKTGKGGEGGDGGKVDIDVGKGAAPDKAGKGGKASKAGKLLSGAGKVLSKAALPLAAGMAAVDAFTGYQKAGENLEIEGREATLGEKLSSSAGSVVSGLTFGLLDEKKASKGIASFFGAGPGKDKKGAEGGAVLAAKPTEAVAATAPAISSAGAPSTTTIDTKPKVETAASKPPAAEPKVESAASKPPAAEPTVKPAPSKPAGKPSAGKGSAKEKMEGEENLQKLEEKEAELQTLQQEYKDEKAKVSEKLANDTKNYPDGFVDDPSDPEYPKELKAVDDKYKPKIEALKKEVSTLSAAPGVEGAKKAQAAEDTEEEDEKPTTTPKTKVTGEPSVEKTTTTETVSGGGETTTKRVQTEEAKAAEKELAGLDDKQAAERKQVVDKLKAEGKITGRFAKSSDYETIPELKELKTKQEAERAAISEKISSGTSLETSTVTPPPQTTTTATTVSALSAENKDLTMDASKGGTPAVISSNNVQNNNTTSFAPIKTSPRGGTSSLERKLDTIASV